MREKCLLLMLKATLVLSRLLWICITCKDFAACNHLEHFYRICTDIYHVLVALTIIYAWHW